MTNLIKRHACSLCGSTDKSSLLSKPFFDESVWNFLETYYENRIPKEIFKGEVFEIFKCQNCGFIWQAGHLNEALMSELYGSWISTKDSLAKKQNNLNGFAFGYVAEASAIASLIKKAPSSIDVLDFGMGWGYWLMTAKLFGYNVSGFEVSKERIEFAKNNGLEVILDLANKKFDFINAEQVFEHVDNPLQTLKDLVETLNPDGVIRISVPNGADIERECKKSTWKASKNAIHPLEHINCFTHSSLKTLAKNAGLTFIKQPILSGPNSGILGSLKSYIGRFYRQHFGTVLYFRR